jgi:non-ribosomal peptide synthetase component F
MGIALVLAAALAWWLHKRGELLPNLMRLLGTGAGGLIAIRMLETGHLLAAALAGAAAWGWWTYKRPTDPAVRARRLLGVAEGADAAAIQTAWRIAISNAHPDAGGSDAAARAVTEARDLLLQRLDR